MDERQVLIRGNIFKSACFLAIIYLGLFAVLNDFEIINIEKQIGISEFLMTSVIFIVAYISVMSIWKDAYFGPKDEAVMKRFMILITIFAVAFDGFVVSHVLSGELPSLMIVSALIMVNLICGLLYYKTRNYKL